MAKNQARRATPKEVIEIGKLLAEHWDDEKKNYKEGYDDKRLAAIVSTDLSDRSVATVRTSLGMLIMSHPYKSITPQVEALVTNLANVSAVVAKLVDDLAACRADNVALRLRMAKLEYLVDRIGNLTTLRATTFRAIAEEADSKFKLQ